MKVVCVDEALPFPPDSGKRIRTLALLSRAARAHEVTLVAPVERGTRDEAAAPAAVEALASAGIEVVAVPRPPLRKRGPRFALDLLRSVPSRAPYMVLAHRQRAVRDAVGDLLARRRPDLIHVEWTPLVVNVPAAPGCPVVVSAHNVEADIWARYRTAQRSWLRRAYVVAQHRKVDRFERAALAAADGVVAVSEGDGARIRATTGQRHVDVVENGVDAAYFEARPGAAAGSTTLLYLGSLDWRPNQDAVRWFLDEIFPRVREGRPEVGLEVVGRAPPPAFVARCASVPGVSVFASVPDVRPHLARAAALVVPLRVGGGSRLKICEALAMGRPVVSTSVGAEGLDLDGGVELADDPATFAETVRRVLDRPGDAEARAARGRAAVLARHEWGRLAPRLCAAWEAAVDRRKRGVP